MAFWGYQWARPLSFFFLFSFFFFLSFFLSFSSLLFLSVIITFRHMFIHYKIL